MLPNHIVTTNSLSQSFQSILAANQGRNCVWAIVELSNSASGNSGYWATHSTQNVVQVIGEAIKNRIEQAAVRTSGRQSLQRLGEISMKESRPRLGCRGCVIRLATPRKD